MERGGKGRLGEGLQARDCAEGCCERLGGKRAGPGLGFIQGHREEEITVKFCGLEMNVSQ